MLELIDRSPCLRRLAYTVIVAVLSGPTLYGLAALARALRWW